MPNASFLRQQSQKCLRLAAACTDQTMTDQLSKMAVEYQSKANAMDEPPCVESESPTCPETKELYSSANGDVWYLVRYRQSGKVFVRHQPNVNSGGQVSETDVDAFLRRSGNPPEKQAILELAGNCFRD